MIHLLFWNNDLFALLDYLQIVAEVPGLEQGSVWIFASQGKLNALYRIRNAQRRAITSLRIELTVTQSRNLPSNFSL
jgi:hypothetical protein